MSTTPSATPPAPGTGAPAAPSRGFIYTVKRGDTLSLIAARNGLASWRQIYDAPENAEFRAKRPDPNLIFPGDKVFVPNPSGKQEPAPTGARTDFRKHGTGARLRFIFDDGDADPNDDRDLTFLNVSNLVTTANLPDGHGPDPSGSADPDNFKVEVEDLGERGASIPAARASIEALKPDGAGNFVPFNPPRKLQIELQRVNDLAGNPTHKYRSRYLRLVTDTLDQAANADQCLLMDWDPSAPDLEILDQVVQLEYTRADGSKPRLQINVGNDRRRIRMAVHVVNRTPGGAPIVTLPDATKRVQKWYRRSYAQANLAPKLMIPVDAVDPPRNMLVISNNSGANAAGNANNRMRFDIRGGSAGYTYTAQAGDTPARIASDHKIANFATIYNHANNAAHRARRPDPNVVQAGDTLFIPASGGVVTIVFRPARSATPTDTANAIAVRVRTAGYTADVTTNDARPGDPRGSADVLIKEGAALVTLLNESSLDTAQTLTVARVVTTTFIVSSANVAGGFASHNIGSAEQRALARNYRPLTAGNRVECFVVGVVQYDDASTTIRGRACVPSLFRPVAERPSMPLLRCTFMADSTMNATNDAVAGDTADANPFTFPHESGHVIIDAFHANQANQLMAGGGTSGTNVVAGTKRIFDSPVAFAGMGALSPLNQVARLRSSGGPVLENWT